MTRPAPKKGKREMHDFVVRVREVVIAEYIVSAFDAEEAQAAVEKPTKPLIDRRELETIDWEVQHVEKIS